MAIRCPYCSREFDVTLFEFGRQITCECGNPVSLQHAMSKNSTITGRSEEKKIREIKRAADKIAYLIVSTDYPEIDVEIEIMKFRERISDLFPDRLCLFDLIYEPRFKRLKEQFRDG